MLEQYNEPTFKYCVAPLCSNTTRNASDKVFFQMPRPADIRREWRKILKTNVNISPYTNLYCCEDHFDVKQDTSNYMEYNIMKQQGHKIKLRLKKGVLPHIFLNDKQNGEVTGVLSRLRALLSAPRHPTPLLPAPLLPGSSKPRKPYVTIEPQHEAELVVCKQEAEKEEDEYVEPRVQVHYKDTPALDPSRLDIKQEVEDDAQDIKVEMTSSLDVLNERRLDEPSPELRPPKYLIIEVPPLQLTVPGASYSIQGTSCSKSKPSTKHKRHAEQTLGGGGRGEGTPSPRRVKIEDVTDQVESVTASQQY